MVGRLISFWEGKFSEAMLKIQGVPLEKEDHLFPPFSQAVTEAIIPSTVPAELVVTSLRELAEPW